ncbi:hypothetical protein CYLTODRAFT_489536 [Cylindrobasidium torrendii FP15055 ss-10]|uniref:Uncharacterized protein n=1 Tax=Cylindrobasidium torrendii FP15055 ss-10 TaxID=1314674 RepID=A0A0D7BEW5_9AGAR|nr:hypothetical protein CYLTODRAFT_489536 [Cylindrobasidium torrendii FP15055 ss-10]
MSFTITTTSLLSMPSRERLACKDKRLNKNSVSLPVLRDLVQPHTDIVFDDIALGAVKPVSLPDVADARQPRRRWTVSSLSQAYFVTVHATKHPRSAISSIPNAPRKLRSSRTTSPLDKGAPLRLVPYVEDDSASAESVDLVSDCDVVTDSLTPKPYTKNSVSPPGIASGDAGVAQPFPDTVATSPQPSFRVELASIASGSQTSLELEEQGDADGRTLHRKGAMGQLRKSAPPCPSPINPPSAFTTSSRHHSRRHNSQPVRTPQSSSFSSTTSIPITVLQAHHRSYSSSSSNIPPGHISRPYYSTVMRRSPASGRRSLDHSPSPPPSVAYRARPMSLDAAAGPRVAYNSHVFSATLPVAGSTPSIAYTPGEFGYIPPSGRSSRDSQRPGFSVSGETEMRMALADDAYKYRDTKSRGVRGHVRRIKEKLFSKK